MKLYLSMGIIMATALVAAILYWQFEPGDMAMTINDPDQSGPAPRYWVAPMDADYRRDEPGLSPMGMPLIPVFEGGDTISVSSSIQQNLGVRTAPVLLEDFSPRIAAVGYTHWDESSIEILHTRAQAHSDPGH